MPPTPANTGVNPKDNPALGEEQEPDPIFGPPEEEFWERYNKRLEFPLSAVGTVFLHVVVGAVLIFVLVGLMNSGEDRSGPAIKLGSVSGTDDTGDGSEGTGIEDTNLARPEKDPFIDAVPNELPNPKSDPSPLLTDPGKNLADPNKIAPTGGSKGVGTAGTGPGGVGADSTRARGYRWVLRFKVTSGKDYLEQLKALRAEIVIPVPPDDKKRIVIQDLNNPAGQKVADSADERRLNGKIMFSDTRRQMVREVIETLGVNLPGQPKAFYAHFPKDLEDELARKEVGYRNRRPEAIEETIFRVTIRGGSYEVVVEEQTPKR